MNFAYYFILVTGMSLSVPFWIFYICCRPASFKKLTHRLNSWKTLPQSEGSLWIHASSVGEAIIAKPLLASLKEKFPDCPVFLSTYTQDGLAIASVDNDDNTFLLPPDLPFLMRQLIKRIKPKALILIEAELWPSLLLVLRDKEIPTYLVNGRISQKSFRRYKKVPFFYRWLTSGIELFLMRTHKDANKAIELGTPIENIAVTGNIKYDILKSSEADSKPWVVFGSTRQGDESWILEGTQDFLHRFPEWKFVFAPRHPKRLGEAEKALSDKGWKFTRHSQLNKDDDNWQVLLIDQLGVLTNYYDQASIAIVGGGFSCEHGGQNIIEPAALGLPVLYGNHMDNFEEEAEWLTAAGGGIPIASPEQLKEVLARLIMNTDERKWRGEAGKIVVQNQKGALEKNIRLLSRAL